MKKTNFIFVLIVGCLPVVLTAQADRWQQRVRYTMDIDMDVRNHQYSGQQKLVYFNNSPDTLTRVFYHLYFNAFQPGSMMDERNIMLSDPDSRVESRIGQLKPSEQGYIRVKSLMQDGQPLKPFTNETILEVDLATPLLPGDSTLLAMEWDAQVPIQIRRSGRDNSEGIEYSMTQWYPKLCEYDYQGWHANPYVGREFYGVWGDFEVTIHIDRSYVVAAGGYLQNPQEVGYGYETPGIVLKQPEGKKLHWRFKAPNVHDFAWAADPDYTQMVVTADDGTIMRFFWQKGKSYTAAWEKLPLIMNRARMIMNTHFGKYPYQEYSFIQGGDGGMEYPLATLITGNRPINSLVGVAVHEQLHSWYQMILGTNESLYAWMDEGFTSYAENIVMNELAKEGVLPNRNPVDDPFLGEYSSYSALANSGLEEPLTTHADYFNTNFAYSYAAYVKGAVFLRQLEYVIGSENVRRGLLRYFDVWKFKHPKSNDFIRIMEKQSGLELDWYREGFVNTINSVDYIVRPPAPVENNKTRITLEKKGRIAMPLDVLITFSDGSQELYYAPLESMRGEKPAENGVTREVLPDHRWVSPVYSFDIKRDPEAIIRIELDPTHRLADIDLSNNIWQR